MKKAFLFVFSLFTYGASFAQLTNAGFENWTDNPVPAYSNPDGWTTLNSLSTALGSQLVFKATASDEVNSGTAAAKMITAQLAVGVTPGVITNGVIDAQSQSIIGGQPISERPAVFGGWFRYDPANVDTGIVSVTLTRWDATNGVRETVGTANEDIFNTNGLYENVELFISYSSTETPDTVLIIMGPGDDIEPQVGSALFADDIYFSNPTASIETPESIGLSVYPNPASEELRITSIKNAEMQSYIIYSLDGKRVGEGRLNSSSAIVDVKSLTNGQYNLVIKTSGNEVVNHKFLKF
jgi:hypothetical protein